MCSGNSSCEIERACEIITLCANEVETDEKEFEVRMERYARQNDTELVRESTIFIDWSDDAYLGKWMLLARQKGGRVFQVARFVGREESEPYVYLEYWKFQTFKIRGKSVRLLTAEHVLGSGALDCLPDFPTRGMDAATLALHLSGRLDLTPETQYKQTHMNDFSGMYVRPWRTEAMEQVIAESTVDDDVLSSPKFAVPFIVKVDVCGRFSERLVMRYFPEWQVENI